MDESKLKGMMHELKTDPEQFDLVDNGTRSSTLRWNDRVFVEGDYVLLRQTESTGDEMKGHMSAPMAKDRSELHLDIPEAPKPLVYTGRILLCRVTHVLTHKGLQPGWVVLSLEILDGQAQK